MDFPFQHLLIDFCNVTTIGCSFVMKLPQMVRLLRTRNAHGISSNGVLIEYLAHLIVFCYNWVQNYPVLSYFEYTLLLIQDVLLILIIFQANGLLDIWRVGGLGLSIALFYGFTIGIPDPSILSILINFVIPIGASSKLLYIRELWKTGNGANVSLATWLIAAYTCLARVITNSMKGDLPLFLHSMVSLTLCTTMVISAIHFQRKPAGPVPGLDDSKSKASLSSAENHPQLVQKKTRRRK